MYVRWRSLRHWPCKSALHCLWLGRLMAFWMLMMRMGKSDLLLRLRAPLHCLWLGRLGALAAGDNNSQGHGRWRSRWHRPCKNALHCLWLGRLTAFWILMRGKADLLLCALLHCLWLGRLGAMAPGDKFQGTQRRGGLPWES